MRLLGVVLAICALVTFGGTAAAEVRELAGAGVQLDVPSGWQTEPYDRGLRAGSDDGTVLLSLYSFPSDDTAASWASYMEFVTGAIEQLSLGAVEPVTLAKMKGQGAAGTGVYEGQAVHIRMIEVVTPRKHILSIFVRSSSTSHDAEVDAMLASVKARPYKVEGEGYLRLSIEAQDFAERVATMIEKNDAAGFLTIAGPGLTGRKVKKAKKLVKLLKLPAKGAWHARPGDAADSFLLWRGKSGKSVPMVEVAKVEGSWRVLGAIRGTTALPPPPPPPEPTPEPVVAADAWPATGGYCYDWPYHRCHPTVAACDQAAAAAAIDAADYERDVYDVENPDTTPPPCRHVSTVYCRTNVTGAQSCFASQSDCEHFGACQPR